jgi:chromate transporter
MVDVVTVVRGLASATVLVRWKPNSTWLVLGGAALGWATYALGIVGIFGGK